jgi:hypothetical protein
VVTKTGLMSLALSLVGIKAFHKIIFDILESMDESDETNCECEYSYYFFKAFKGVM